MRWKQLEMEFLLAQTAVGWDAEDLRWAVAVVRSRAVASGRGDGAPMLVPLLDMANHAPREQANAALCDIADDGSYGGGGGGGGGRRSKAVVALKALQAGEELLFVYESDEEGPGAGGRAPRSSSSSSSPSRSSGGGSLASSLRSKLGVVPTGKLVADYGFVAELGVSQGVTFLTGELERLLEGLTAESSESPGGVATDMDTEDDTHTETHRAGEKPLASRVTASSQSQTRAAQSESERAPQMEAQTDTAQKQKGLEAAMLLTSTMMDDFKLLKEDAIFAREGEGEGEGDSAYGYGGSEPLPLAPRLRLALLYKLGRTAAILRAFAEERKGRP